ATSELGRIFCSCRQLQGDFGDGRVTTGQSWSQGLSKSGRWSALSGRVNGGTLDRCPAPLQWRSWFSKSGDTGRNEESGANVVGNQDAIAQRQSSLPPVQTVTPLTRCAYQPTIPHHPPVTLHASLPI